MRVFRLNRTILLIACLYGAGVTGARFAYAADSPAEKLHALERKAEESRQQRDSLAKEADQLAGEIAKLRHDSIVAAETTQYHEAALSELEEQLKSLNAREVQKSGELRLREQERARMLMALVRLAHNPPEALALAARDPADASRSALLMGAAVPDLDRAAHNLTRDLTQLIALRQTIRDAEERHRSDTRSLDSEKARLASLIGRKAELQQRAALGAQEHNGKLVKLVAEAASLKDLMERLDAARKKDEAALAAVAASTVATFRPPEIGAGQPMIQTAAPAMIPLGPSRPNTIRPFAAARGNFLLPAAGKLVVNFGQNDPQGIVNKGLTYETRAGAQVVAPFDGRIAYAGSFRGYGQILIIEHGDGYHSLLAGLDKVEGAAGQWLVAGEPVGTMPGADGPPRLYLELRHDGQPVNPLPWLATANEKVSG